MKHLFAALLLCWLLAAGAQVPEPQTRLHSVAVFTYCGRSTAIQLLMVGAARVELHLFLRDVLPVTDYSELTTLVTQWRETGGTVTTTELNPECTKA